MSETKPVMTVFAGNNAYHYSGNHESAIDLLCRLYPCLG